MRMSIQTKIMALILSLLCLVIINLSGLFAYLEWKDIEDSLGDKALSTATYVAGSPVIRDGIQTENPPEVLQPYAERIREQSGAEFVVIGNENGIRYAHPDEWKIGEKMVGGDNERALMNGESYVSRAEGTLGPSLRGKSPIRDEDGRIIGVVSVGFLIEDLHAIILNRISLVGLLTLATIVIGVIGAILLSKSIRKDMYGLEPYQIAQLFQERQAILKTIREGIVAIDKNGMITMVNKAAKHLLPFEKKEKIEGRPIENIIPDSLMLKVLKSGEPIFNEEISWMDRVFIINIQPIIENEEITGVVSSFRDKTEMIEMANTLSDIKRYSDDIRSQNHEYTNKLYALSGYLQLGKTKEAMDLIEEESMNQEKQSTVLFRQIKDPTVQAVLAGKTGRASEMKVKFEVDDTSQLEPLPGHISQTQIVSVLGNIIDNAFDAAVQGPTPEVSFFVTDIGNDIVLEVSDNGPGLPMDVDILVEKGFSTKQGNKKRGYGLAIVQEIVTELGGMMECHNQPEDGAIFTVYLPKSLPAEQGRDMS